MPNKKIFFFAGEQSGDKLGAELIKPLKADFPHLNVIGVGGALMRDAGLDPILKLEAFQTMGFIGVIKRLPFFLKAFQTIKRYILEQQPDLIVLIDYPGFNLRLARSLKRAGVKAPIVQYVCPSVWAWGKKRIPLMQDHLDSLMTLLPFEPEIFDPKKLHCTYVGHPLAKKSPSFSPRHTYSEAGSFNIGLFPGSRLHEIKDNLPRMLTSLKKLNAFYPKLKLHLVVANTKVEPLIHELIRESGLDISLTAHSHMQTLLPQLDLGLATSGTITLELALANLPCIVVYHISKLDQFIATKIFKINLPHYSLPNIIMGQAIYPELFGTNYTEKNLIAHIKAHLEAKEAPEFDALKKKLHTSAGCSAFSFLKEHYSSLLH